MMISGTKPYPFGNVMKHVCGIWGGNEMTYPGPQPTSIERKHLPLLSKNKYYICDKTDGVRYAFVCCMVDGKKIACIVDRKLNAQIIRLRIPRQCALGTILDGEIITNDAGKTVFLVYDCVAMCGKATNTLPFKERMLHTDTFLKTYKRSDTDAVLFLKKEIVPFAELNTFLDLRREYKSDGVILIPNDEPVKINTHPTYFKLKNGTDNTVDFGMDRSGSMYLQQSGTLKKTTNKIIDNSFEIIDFDNVSEMINGTLYIIVECECIGEKNWTVKHTRIDKNMPNSIYTHKKTMINIKENIQLMELKSVGIVS
jgi:hypothetical protein